MVVWLEHGMKPHKHAELIKQWADGAVIQQYKPHLDEWHDTSPYPVWDERVEYRVKPEPKKYKVYIYNDMSKGTSWVDARNPSEFTPHKNYMYMGSIEVEK
jgi:hypothetical protein